MFIQQALSIAPRLLIILPINYPNELPLVFETEGKIKNDHVMFDGGLCLATEFDLRVGLCDSKSIKDYIDKFLIPFFISDYSWRTKREYVFGDRSHGVAGFYQSIADYFKLKEINKDCIQNILRWSIRERSFKTIFSDDSERLKVKNKYSLRIGVFRKVGILNIKKIYKALISMKEFEKNIMNILNFKRIRIYS